MSLKAMLWALWDAPVTDPSQTLVLLAMCDRAGDDGLEVRCYQREIARKSRMSTRTVRRRLVELEQMGIIRRGDQAAVSHIPEHRRPVVWDIALELKGNSLAEDESATPGQSDRGSPGKAPTPGQQCPNPPDSGVRTPRTLLADRTVIEQSGEQRKRSSPVSPLLATLRAEVPLPAPECPHGLKPWRCPQCDPKPPATG